MNFKNRVESARNDLTTAEAKAAEYILGHLEDTVKYNVKQLSVASGSSSATIVRMVKKLDIESFTAMKIMISMDLAAKDQKPHQDLDIKANESYSSITDKLAENEIKNIQQTKDILKMSDCEKVVKRLLITKTLYVFGIGASALAAENIHQKWSRIGFHVVVGRDINVFLTELSNATKEDTIWLISNSGDTPEMIYLAEYAKKNKLYCITLTMFGQNYLSKLADVPLKTSRPMEPDVRVGATNSITGQFFVIDTILYLYFSRDFDKSFKAITASKSFVKDYKKHFKP